MELIHYALAEFDASLPRVELLAERPQLAKRRWRAAATDGREFRFELDHPIGHGAVFFQTAQHLYRIRQTEEKLLEIELNQTPAQVARLGWAIGNLHFPVEIGAHALRVTDDAVLREFLDRLQIHYRPIIGLFQPLDITTETHRR